jgi:hypothetical protein
MPSWKLGLQRQRCKCDKAKLVSAEKSYIQSQAKAGNKFVGFTIRGAKEKNLTKK